jgi:hypothetical protein
MIRVRYIARDSGFIKDFNPDELSNAIIAANNVVALPNDYNHIVDSIRKYGRYSAIGKTGWVEIFHPAGMVFE